MQSGRNTMHFSRPVLPLKTRVKTVQSSIDDLPVALTPIIDLSESHFKYFQEVARVNAGIVIADFKRSMVARRVKTRLKALNIDSFENYIAYLNGPEGDAELQPLINALTTNKTEFFRENHHFLHLAKHAIPMLSTGRQEPLKRLRVWSAGCSTGEEPYSIAMTLQSHVADKAQIDFRILATDIDTTVLAHARSATYRAADLASWPFSYKTAYSMPSEINPHQVRISPRITNSVVFQPLNLHGRWPMKGPLDIIFCRNVVIYFDRADQKIIFNRMANLLAVGGLLYCGHSESLFGLSDRFRAVAQSIYQRVS